MKLPSLKYTYIIAYQFNSDKGSGFGNTEIIISERIKNIQIIKEIGSYLNSKGFPGQTTIILNYKLLSVRLVWPNQSN